MDLGPDGMLYVADAGGNCVYKVNQATGEITLVAVIPGIEVPAEMVPEGGNPARGGSADIDPVPTSVTITEDGTIYVSLSVVVRSPQVAPRSSRLPPMEQSRITRLV